MPAPAARPGRGLKTCRSKCRFGHSAWRQRLLPQLLHALPSQRAGRVTRARGESGRDAGRCTGATAVEQDLPPPVSEDAGLLRRRHGGAVRLRLRHRGRLSPRSSRAIASRPPNWTPGLNLRIGVIADVHAGGPLMPAERIRAIAERTNAAQARHDRAARRLRGQPQVQDPHRRARGMGRGAERPQGAARRARHPRQPRLVGRPRRAAHRRGARCSAGACWSASASRSTRTTRCGSTRTAAASGSRASATSWPSSRGRRKRAWRRFEGVDDLPGTLAKVTDDAPVILLAHEPDIFPRVPERVSLTLSRPHARRPGAPVRLFADGAVALRQPLRLRPHRRGRPPPDRLGRARLLHPAGAHRRAAGDRDGRCLAA